MLLPQANLTRRDEFLFFRVIREQRTQDGIPLPQRDLPQKKTFLSPRQFGTERGIPLLLGDAIIYVAQRPQGYLQGDSQNDSQGPL